MGSPVYSMVASLPAFHFRFDLTQWKRVVGCFATQRKITSNKGEGEGQTWRLPSERPNLRNVRQSQVGIASRFWFFYSKGCFRNEQRC